MAGMRWGRRLVLAWAAAAALSLAVPVALADDVTYPEADVYAYDQTIGGQADISFDFIFVPSAPAAETLVVTVPNGYAANVAQAVGTRLGYAEIDANPSVGGANTVFKGSAVVADPAAFAADPVAQACAPGTHTAILQLAVAGSSSVAVPIAVDQITDGTASYHLTVCLEPLRAAGFKPTDVYFVAENVFQNPTTADTYWWRTLVTPLDANGVPAPIQAYELHSSEPIPETLTIKPAFNKKRHLFVAQGRLLAASGSRAATRVHLLAGPTPDKVKEIGIAVTDNAGRYLFRARYSKAPIYIWAHVNTYHYPYCIQPSSAPGGCASQTIDGTDSPTTKVVIVQK